MGTYDYFEIKEEGQLIQIKIFGNIMHVYREGDRVPFKEYGLPKTFAVVIPSYSRDDPKPLYFAIIKDGIFTKCTKDKKGIIHPLFDKWGGHLEKLEDFKNPFAEVVEDFKKMKRNG